MPDLDTLLAEIRACRICAEHLPLGPRPVLRVSKGAKLLIIGQALGTKVHESGVPWDDASGIRLRGWLDMEPEVFYDEARVAIVILLFYLTPVWTTLITRFVFGHAVHPIRYGVIVLGLLGLILTLGRGGFVPLPERAGEWYPRAAGLDHR